MIEKTKRTIICIFLALSMILNLVGIKYCRDINRNVNELVKDNNRVIYLNLHSAMENFYSTMMVLEEALLTNDTDRLATWFKEDIYILEPSIKVFNSSGLLNSTFEIELFSFQKYIYDDLSKHSKYMPIFTEEKEVLFEIIQVIKEIFPEEYINKNTANPYSWEIDRDYYKLLMNFSFKSGRFKHPPNKLNEAIEQIENICKKELEY